MQSKRAFLLLASLVALLGTSYVASAGPTRHVRIIQKPWTATEVVSGDTRKRAEQSFELGKGQYVGGIRMRSRNSNLMDLGVLVREFHDDGRFKRQFWIDVGANSGSKGYERTVTLPKGYVATEIQVRANGNDVTSLLLGGRRLVQSGECTRLVGDVKQVLDGARKFELGIAVHSDHQAIVGIGATISKGNFSMLRAIVAELCR